MRLPRILIALAIVLNSGCALDYPDTKPSDEGTQGMTIAPVVVNVVDEQGRPAAGVDVLSVVEFPGDDPKLEFGPVAVSDSDGEAFIGEFHISRDISAAKEMLSVQAPRYTLIARQDDNGLGSLTMSVNQSHRFFSYGEDLRIVVSNLKPCKGIVVDEKGQPLAGVRVKPVMNESVLHEVVPLNSARTDSAGEYFLPQCPMKYGSQSVEVQKDGYVRKPYTSGEETSHRRIVMVRTGAVTGRVIDEAGRPVAGAQVSVEEGRTPVTATTDEQGRFKLEGVTPGRCVVRLKPTASFLLAQAKGWVAVQSGETTDVGDVVALPSVVVSGRIVDSSTGEELEGYVTAQSLRFELDRVPHGWPAGGGSSRYSLRLLPGETYRLHVIDTGTLFVFDWGSGRELTVPKEGVTNLDLKVKKVITGKGIALDSRGNAITNALIRMSGFQQAYAMGPIYGRTRTDAQGKFEIPLRGSEEDRPVPETVELTVTDIARRMDFIHTVDWDEFTQGSVTLTCESTVELRVIVKDKDTEEPLKGAYVCYRNHWLKTGTTGEAVFRMNAKTGNCRITVYKPSGSTHSKSSAMLPDPDSEGWSDTVTILMALRS